MSPGKKAVKPLPPRPCGCTAEEMSGCCTLQHLKVALIGGLDRLENQYRSAFESLGTVKFYFHTGCCGGSGANRLRASARDADIVVFITRVNSHNALNVIKGICRKSGKSFLALRETNPALVSKLVSQEWQIRKKCGQRTFSETDSGFCNRRTTGYSNHGNIKRCRP